MKLENVFYSLLKGIILSIVIITSMNYFGGLTLLQEILIVTIGLVEYSILDNMREVGE